VEFAFDLVDRLLHEVMRGFGSVPKRGVEMGGILLGSVRREDARLVVQVEDFEPISCNHSKGMTWQLAGEEVSRFEEVLGRWREDDGKRTYAVGFYRSHTREGMALTAEDVEMFDRYFPEASDIALLVKPFATRVSVGAVFIRENGTVRTEQSYKEFPFRLRELGGERVIANDPKPEPRHQTHAQSSPKGGPSPMASAPMSAPPLVSDQLPFGIPTATTGEGSGKKLKSGWVWIPLSFIFLLLGVVLGVQISMSVSTRIPAAFRQDPYTLGLTAAPAGDGVHVRWDRSSPAIQASSRGQLTIIDGGNQKVVNLDTAQLQNGSVIYRRSTGDVRFRLEVFARDRVTVAETAEFRESGNR
jgi:hypothetical protein